MKNRFEIIWLTLVILTLFAYLLGYLKYISSFFVAVLLLTTFIKGALIAEYFMGLRDVSLRYRAVPIIWLTLVTSLIALTYYLPL